MGPDPQNDLNFNLNPYGLELLTMSTTRSRGDFLAAELAPLMGYRIDRRYFLASDAHDTEWRPPDLRVPYRIIASESGEDVAERLFVTNPRNTLTGKYFDYEDPDDDAGKSKAWYKFW